MRVKLKDGWHTPPTDNWLTRPKHTDARVMAPVSHSFSVRMMGWVASSADEAEGVVDADGAEERFADPAAPCASTVRVCTEFVRCWKEEAGPWDGARIAVRILQGWCRSSAEKLVRSKSE